MLFNLKHYLEAICEVEKFRDPFLHSFVPFFYILRNSVTLFFVFSGKKKKKTDHHSSFMKLSTNNLSFSTETT